MDENSSVGLYLGKHNPIFQTPSPKQLILLHHFSSTLYWAACQPQCRGICRRIRIPIQMCNFDILEDAITRRICAISFAETFARFLTFPSSKTFSLESLPVEGFLPSVSVCGLRSKRRRLSLLTDDYSSGQNCKSLLLNTVQLLSTDHPPVLRSTLTFLPFFDLTNSPVSILSLRALKLRVLAIW